MDRDVFNWAKTKAEIVHRYNLRRLSVYPSERTATVIDEALLERHIRGNAGPGIFSGVTKFCREIIR